MLQGEGNGAGAPNAAEEGLTVRAKRQHEHPRRDRRHGVDILGVIRTSDRSALTCRVTNISGAGFAVEAPLPIGDRVVAHLQGLGRVEAQVRWSLGGRSGLTFISPAATMRETIEEVEAAARMSSDDTIWNAAPEAGANHPS